MLFAMTWSEKVTPAGRHVCRLAVSGRRTSDNDCGGWPSPCTPNGGRSISPDQMDATGRTLDGKKHTASMEHAVKFASWPSPMAGSPATETYNEAGDTCNGRKTRLLVAGWATASARDHKDGMGQACANLPKTAQEAGRGIPLSREVHLTHWTSPNVNEQNERPDVKDARNARHRAAGKMKGVGSYKLSTQVQTLGQTPTGSTAETANIGQLNPAHSRWLMGYPPAWDVCAVTAMPSSRKSRRK